MKIMHVITRLILGGAQENTLLTVEGLLARGHDVELVTGPAIGPEGDLIHRAERHHVPLVIVKSMRRAINPVLDSLAFLKLIRLMRRMNPDVVHTHSSKAGILGRLAARRCGVPVIVHTIHGLPFHPYQNFLLNRLYVFLERRCARYSTRIVSVADAMTRQALAAGVGHPDQFVTVYSGMEVEPFLEARTHRAGVRAELGIEPDELVVGKIARLSDLKGHTYLFQAVPEVLKRFPRTRFLLVGDGWLRGELEEDAHRLGIFDRLIFTGLVPPARIPELIGAMDVVVHTSLREGLARVLPQALIAGVPVVSYDVDGAAEVVLEGQTGFLVPPMSIRPLAEALVRLLASPELRERFGRRGQELVTDRFRAETMVRRIEEVYRQTMGEPPQP